MEALLSRGEAVRPGEGAASLPTGLWTVVVVGLHLAPPVCTADLGWPVVVGQGAGLGT